MASNRDLIIRICLALLVVAIPACAQNPISNPGFEQGLNSWITYTYQPAPDAKPANPAVGCLGESPCHFNLLHPTTAPDGSNVCGIQSYETSGNGGVCQSFTWSGGPASICVTARSYSERYDGTPFNAGCLVRMGLVSGVTQDRSMVTSWVVFPWSDIWHKRTLLVPGSGTYTLFIEAYQPRASAIMSTLWDKVEFFDQPPVLIATGPNVAAADTSVIITWTTNVASSSVVDYGPTLSYGQSAGSGALVTNHSVTISGLTHSSQYYFRVTSAVSGYLGYTSDNLSFQTPIWFSDIVAQVNSTGTAVTIDWLTDVQTTTRVEYWIGSGTHMFTTEIPTMTTTHEVSIAGLIEGSEYSFRVLGRHQPEYSDAASAVSTFWTLPVSPTLANGSFEDIKPGQGHSIYPWVQYTTQDGVSGYNPINGLLGPYPAGGSTRWLPSGGFPGVQAYDSSFFLGAGAHMAYKNGGVFQRVSANPGEFYTLTARYLTHRVGGEDGYTEVRIGVDPNGGVNPRSLDIQWWSGYSFTNDDKWHSAAVTVTGGDSGVATVFLEFEQVFALEWHVAAIDGVTFGPPLPTSIGALKSSKGSLGGILEDKIVTYVRPGEIWTADRYCYKAYVEEDNRTAGLAILLPTGSSSPYPVAGKKLSVTGALGVYDREAALLAASWTVDDNISPPIKPIPEPVGMPQAFLGKPGQNQPAILPESFGLCNVGLRVRVFGRVTWISPTGAVYIDDGANMQDGTKTGAPPVPVSGLRSHVIEKESSTPSVGDYIAVTGILGVELIDLNGWPDPSDYYVYSIFTRSADDWDLLWTGLPSMAKR